MIAFKNAKVSCPAILQTLTCLCDSNIFKKESALGRSCRPKSSPDFNYFHTYLHSSPLNYASYKNNPSDIGSKWYIFKKMGREKMQDKYVYVGCHDLLYKMRYFFPLMLFEMFQ